MCKELMGGGDGEDTKSELIMHFSSMLALHFGITMWKPHFFCY